MQTERVTFLASPVEKAGLMRKAAGLGVSSSEVIRRALRRYDDEPADDEALAALVAEANAAIPKIAASLDRVSKRLEEIGRENDAFLREMGVRA